MEESKKTISFTGVDGEKIACQDHSQFSFDEALQEAEQVLIFAAFLNPAVEKEAYKIQQLIQEFLHWLYCKPGEHPKVSAILEEAIKEAQENMLRLDQENEQEDFGRVRKSDRNPSGLDD